MTLLLCYTFNAVKIFEKFDVFNTKMMVLTNGRYFAEIFKYILVTDEFLILNQMPKKFVPGDPIATKSIK